MWQYSSHIYTDNWTISPLITDMEKKGVEFDDVLVSLGEFGAYQRRVVFLLCLVLIPSAFHTLSYVFWAAKPPHWCEPPSSPALDNLTHEEILNLTVPWEERNGKMMRSQCYLRDVALENQTDLGNATYEMLNREWNGTMTRACNKWQYDTSVYKSTLVTELNLVCDRKWWTATTQSVYMAGYLVGSSVYGYLPDRFGRRKLMLTSSMLAIVFSTCSAFASNIYLVIVLRFLVAVNARGESHTAFVILMEIVGPSWRSFTGSCFMLVWAFGYILLAGIAYAIRDRFTLQLVTSVPLAVMIIIYYWVIPESPRWLLAKGRTEEATAIIDEMAKRNGVKLPADRTIIVKSEQKSQSTLLELLRSTHLRKMSLILIYLWIANNTVYYGLTLNTSNLGGNDYLNFFASGAAEIPAYLLLYVVLRRCSRRWSFAAVMVTAGVMLFAIWPVPQDLVWLRVTLATVGKFAITMSYAILYIYSAELFPTVVRSVGMGMCSFVARIGGMLAPYAADLDDLYKGLPILIFGTLSIIGSLLIMLLPNTKDTKLTQTIEEGEATVRLHFPRLCAKKSSTENHEVTDDSANGKVHSTYGETMQALIPNTADNKYAKDEAKEIGV